MGGLKKMLDGRMFKIKSKFGGPNKKKDLKAWKKNKNMECERCGIKRSEHAFVNHDFQEGGK